MLKPWVLVGFGFCVSLGACVDSSTDGDPALAGAPGTAGSIASTGGDDPGGGGSGATVGGGVSTAGDMGSLGGSVEDMAGSGGSVAGAMNGGSAGIDYSIWQLQLPTGSAKADSVAPKDLSRFMDNAYFFLAQDGGRVFMDPKMGTPTGGSDHPRSELRESNVDGSEAGWSSSGTNTLTVTGKGLMLSGSTRGNTTIAQVFVADENTLAELEYNGSSMSLFYEEAKSMGSTVPLSNTSIPLNTKYTFVLGYSKNVLTVTVNNKVVYTKMPSPAVSGKKFYFKVGNYDQTATVGTPTTTPYTQIEVYSAAVVHQ